ncbi:MAG: 50S ribosomal protein L17 [Candidatus Pacebacteria bacterium]|jgi:large subunit ribosomal protein L17|nr:50S ribosomal protein L17 [Candidatus Paceibacterota bacterium]MBT4652364.1 50S ribosomal protein L17 [Candidatus Paceibacterota bacterium]MBT6756191.1 50S ribosomal protein L17 [Candidatus Paceibacterota bacterium]MBT6921482.1 50S ribosomal protein L17 [Candidatus Paceibacterota bacterium]
MRHRRKIKHFNRDTKSRKALLRNLLRSLVEHGEVVTTEAKAKEIKRWADKLISKAQNDTLATRRQLHSFFGKRDIVNTLVDRVAPAMKDRKSGFSSISKIGTRRGDNADVVKLSLMEKSIYKLGLKAPKKYKPAEKKTTTLKGTSKKVAATKKTPKKTVKKAEK